MEELFAEACEKSPEERRALLDRECEGDPVLRAEVEALLAADAAPRPPLTAAVRGALQDWDAATSAAVTHFGPWRVEGLLGRGGMGAVYRVVRAGEAFSQVGACKVMRMGTESTEARRRFRQERQILARLEHPGISRLIDGGETEQGTPFLVMEFVDGVNLLDYCRQKHLDLFSKLALFEKICAAVSYAHQQLVVHRDIKPANILVCRDGEPKLLDFGIAKLIAFEGAQENAEPETRTGMFLLTPDYASPEQVRGEAITVATDVYALGAVLYELLSGQRAHRIGQTTPAEIHRTICEAEPPRPSSVAPAAEARLIRGDLDRIAMMALRKEPQRRYASVEQLAADIRRFRDGLPVLAHESTLWYRAQKMVRRHLVAFVTGAAVFALLASAATVTLKARLRAEQRYEEVRALAGRFLFDFYNLIQDVPGTVEAQRLVVSTALEYLDKLAAEGGQDAALNDSEPSKAPWPCRAMATGRPRWRASEKRGRWLPICCM
jgi:serine/threonine protein kinase